MDKLRKSIRQSFRRRGSKDSLEETSKPHQWQKDEAAVRAGTSSFHVKYLGCVEVFESRGMQVCGEALKLLRGGRRRATRGLLHVSGDGLRVVDAENKGLIVDQTIEKVSFCAPDRNHEKGFAYICRDGTTRRWMCHGFIASRDTGERLSHAVGCAFAVCLEQKQKRDREAASHSGAGAAGSTSSNPVADWNSKSATATPRSTSFTGDPAAGDAASTGLTTGASFRRISLAERKQDPQNVIKAEKLPVKQTTCPNAVARPLANRALFERQGSLRMPASAAPALPNKAAPFQRYSSLRMPDLPMSLQHCTGVANNNSHHHANGGAANSPAFNGAIWEEEPASGDFTTSKIESMNSISTSLNGNRYFTGHNDLVTNAQNSAASSTAMAGTSKGDEWLQQAKLCGAGGQHNAALSCRSPPPPPNETPSSSSNSPLPFFAPPADHAMSSGGGGYSNRVALLTSAFNKANDGADWSTSISPARHVFDIPPLVECADDQLNQHQSVMNLGDAFDTQWAQREVQRATDTAAALAGAGKTNPFFANESAGVQI